MLGFRASQCGCVSAAVALVFLISLAASVPAVADSSHTSAADALNAQQLQALSAPSALNAPPRSLTALIGRGQAGGTGVDETQAAPSGWMLVSGELVGQQLARWGQMAGWQVIWSYKQDWVVPSAAIYQGDFTSAATQVLEDLASEGSPVHGIFYQGNHTLVITGGSQ